MVGLEGDSAVVILGGGHVLHGGAVIGNIVNHRILHAGGDGHGHDDLFALVVAGQLNIVSHIVLQQVAHSSDQIAIGGSNIIGSNLADAGNGQFHGNVTSRQALFINRNIEGGSLTAIGNGNGLHAGGGHIGSGVLIAVFHRITLGVDLANEIFCASLGVHSVHQDVDHVKGIANQIIGCALVGNSDLGQFVTLGHINIAVHEHAVVICSKLQISKTAILLHQLISNGSQRVILAHRVQAQVLDGHKIIQLQIVSDDFAFSVAGQFHIKSQEVAEDICKGRLILLVHVSSGHAGQTGSRCFHVVAIVADLSIVGDSVHADTNSDLQRSSGSLATFGVGIGQIVGACSHKLAIDQFCAIFSGNGQLQIIHIQFLLGAITVSDHSLGRCLQYIANTIFNNTGDRQSLGGCLGGKFTLNGHIVGVAGVGICTASCVVLEDHTIGIDCHGSNNANTIVAIRGLDVTSVHISKVGDDSFTARNGHGLGAVLSYIVSSLIHAVVAGMVMRPEDNYVHLLRSSSNDLIPVIGIVIVITARMQRHMGSNKQRLAMIQSINSLCKCSQQIFTECRRQASLAVTHVCHGRHANSINIVVSVSVTIEQAGEIIDITLVIMVTPCVIALQIGVTQARLHSRRHISFFSSSIAESVANKCCSTIGQTRFFHLAHNRLSSTRVSMDVAAKDRGIDGSFSFYTQDRCRQQAHDHDQSQHKRQNSLHIFHTLSSLNLFKFSHYVRPVSPFGTKWVYFARL